MSGFNLAIQGAAQFSGLPARSTVLRWVGAALADAAAPAELTLRYVDEPEGRALNHQFRGKDYATNVLTFDYAHEPVLMADLVICVPVLQREAAEQGKRFRDHLAHLLVHGVLHAQGYDHEDAAQADAMEAREVEILAVLGIANPYA